MNNNLYVGNYIHNMTSGGVLLGGHLVATAQNNICVSCSGGGILDYYSGCSGNFFVNNTVISCGNYGCRFTQSSSSCTAMNNIAYGSVILDYYISSATNLAFMNNLSEDSSLSVSAGNLYSTDPLFVDVNNNVYNLKSTSPCIRYGYNIGSVTSDFYNLTRTNNDIGAIDYKDREY